jgi:serine/threonine protein kinase
MERIGKYEVIRKLGEGATSTVWLARDPFSGRDVAVKLISPEVLKDNERGRAYQRLLKNEASLAGKLVHPHIVQILDAVIGDGECYIVMEYVAGTTLERYCTPGNLLPLERLVEIVFKCTRALDYAFQAGVTHRDIKPANILLADDDGSGRSDIKISDFGAALQVASDVTQVSGVGSPAYMSPQQVREQPLDHRTDIWSLGVVVYQLLTGRLPFQATSSYGMIYQICNADAPPPSSLRPDLPPVLDAVVARALQRDLDTRYASWGEFAQDLARAFRNRQLVPQRRLFPDSEKFETLRSLEFFSDFSDVEIWESIRLSRWDEVAPETVVIKDGEVGNSFCFLTDGELRVAKKGRTLNLLSAGDCFGEMAVIGSRNSGARGADVVAQTNARIVSIPSDALANASDSCRMHFYQSFLRVLARRLSQANARLAGG